MPDVDISVFLVQAMMTLKVLKTMEVEFAAFDLSTHEVTADGSQILPSQHNNPPICPNHHSSQWCRERP
jgi:hypothetical protein